jgi:hypothetical protein
MLVYVRPSNEALLRARVPGAQGQRGCPSSPFHRGGSVSSGDQDRPLASYFPLLKPLNDKKRKGVRRTLDCARPTRAFGGRALREQPLFSFLFHYRC